MSIYSDHVAYAKQVRMPLSLAKAWCDNQLELQKVIDKAKVCPKCGKLTLEIESGSYEEGYGDYVYCSNDEIPTVDEDGGNYFEECDYTAEPVREHEPLNHWYDFDIILAFSIGDSRDNAFGSLREWLEFVRDEVAKITLKETA